MTIEQILNMRFDYEQIVTYRQSFDLPSYESDIDNLKYFINSGCKNNRFRKRFNEAMELAKAIITYYDRPMASLDRQLER
jgi:hypothetical protein